MKTLNAFGCAVNLGIIRAALAKTDLHWAMHQAQLFALEMLGLDELVHTVETIEKNETLALLPPSNFWLAGIPMQIDKSLPKSTIELRNGNEVLYRIENLSIPTWFSSEE